MRHFKNPIQREVIYLSVLTKKSKEGEYKMWYPADLSGYIYCFEFFQGASGKRVVKSDYGASGDVMLRLTHDLHRSNYK